MKTEKEIEDAILKITMKIQNQYPELSKYLAEMPVTVPDIKTPEINIKNLQEYYNSLLALLKKYAPNHDKN
jgi:hypothetical protein